MTKVKIIGVVESHTLHNSQITQSNFIKIIKGENAFIIDGIKGRLL